MARITGREREHDHPGEDQHGPGEDRHAVERHAGRARAQHADDDLDRAGDRRDLDEADAEQPEVRVDARANIAAGQRRIHEPAARRRETEEQRAEEDEAADEVGPEREGAEARERQVARASICGSSNMPIASTTGTANRNIITVPCIVKIWL